MPFNFKAVLASLQGLAAERGSLRATLSELRLERRRVEMAAPTREDVKAFFSRVVAMQGSSFNKTLDKQLGRMMLNPKNFAGDRIQNNMGLLTISSAGATPLSIDHALCALLGSQLGEAMSRVIDGMDWPAGAIPIADRDRLLKELDKKIASAEAEEAEFLTSAEQAGVRVD